MDELNDKLRKSRQVITHKEVPAYFNYDVSPETIIRYIKHEGLPETQKGRLYFISLPELFAWQLGGGGMSTSKTHNESFDLALK